MFWMPLYVYEGLGKAKTTAANIQTCYDLGSMGGGFIIGLISDKLGRRTPVIGMFTLVAICITFNISCIGGSTFDLLYPLITILGFTLSSSCNILASTIGIEMGKQMKGTEKSLGTIIGIIDGSGSLGASLGQVLVRI